MGPYRETIKELSLYNIHYISTHIPALCHIIHENVEITKSSDINIQKHKILKLNGAHRGAFNNTHSYIFINIKRAIITVNNILMQNPCSKTINNIKLL